VTGMSRSGSCPSQVRPVSRGIRAVAGGTEEQLYQGFWGGAAGRRDRVRGLQQVCVDSSGPCHSTKVLSLSPLHCSSPTQAQPSVYFEP
jgi:hypothetical protein